MARSGVRAGTTNPNLLYTGDDTLDLESLVFEDPVGTRVGGIGFGGLLRSGQQMPAIATGGAPQFGAQLRQARAVYDFATQGGAVGTIALTGALGIPSGAIILGGVIDTTTAPTSLNSTATIAIQLNAANDLVTAAAVSGAPWSTTGRKALIPVFTAATMVKATAARDISAVVAVEALTAGHFDVWVVYLF